MFSGQLILNEIDQATTQATVDQATLDKASTALGLFDYGIIFVNVSFYLVSFILVYQIRTNPVYLVPSMLSLAFSIWFSAEIANIYSIFSQVSPITSVANQFPAINQMYNNYALMTAVLGALMIILLYGKTRTGREVTI